MFAATRNAFSIASRQAAVSRQFAAIGQTADKSTLILVRHGESTWNLENKFTGEDRGAERKRSSSPAYRI